MDDKQRAPTTAVRVAGHEVVASVTDTILDWFESQTRNSTTTG